MVLWTIRCWGFLIKKALCSLECSPKLRLGFGLLAARRLETDCNEGSSFRAEQAFSLLRASLSSEGHPPTASYKLLFTNLFLWHAWRAWWRLLLLLLSQRRCYGSQFSRCDSFVFMKAKIFSTRIAQSVLWAVEKETPQWGQIFKLAAAPISSSLTSAWYNRHGKTPSYLLTPCRHHQAYDIEHKVPSEGRHIIVLPYHVLPALIFPLKAKPLHTGCLYAISHRWPILFVYMNAFCLFIWTYFVCLYERILSTSSGDEPSATSQW